MVIDHVHNNADTRLVESVDQPFQLGNAGASVIRIGGIGALGSVKVPRIVAPVELRLEKICLVNTLVIEYGHKLNMGDPKLFYVVYAYRVSRRVYKTVFYKCKKTSLIAEVSALVDGEVADVKLVNAGVGIAFKRNVILLVPAGGTARRRVEYHSHCAVHSHGACVDVNGLLFDTVVGHDVGVVNAVQIAESGFRPYAVPALCHWQSAVRLFIPAAFVKMYSRVVRFGSPHLEFGLFLGI